MTAKPPSGFVSKPFRARELIQTVEEVAAGDSEPPVDETVEEVVEMPTPSPGGDEPCLDWQAALRNLEGDEEFLRHRVALVRHGRRADLSLGKALGGGFVPGHDAQGRRETGEAAAQLKQGATLGMCADDLPLQYRGNY